MTDDRSYLSGDTDFAQILPFLESLIASGIRVEARLDKDSWHVWVYNAPQWVIEPDGPIGPSTHLSFRKVAP